MDNKKKNILVYNTSFFAVSETFIYRQVDVLSKEYNVDLLAKKYVNPHDYDVGRFEKHSIERQKGFINRVSNKLLNRNLFTFSSHRRLTKLLKKKKYSAIHVHYGTNALDILPIAMRYKIPLVVSFHGADASRMVRKKQFSERLPGLFDYAESVIISSRHMADTLQLGDWSDKVHLIPYGVDPEDFKLESHSVNGSADQMKILHSGRIVGKKGVPDLVRVFNSLSKKYKNIEMHVIGDGDQLAECKSLVEEFNLTDIVSFYGAVSQEKVKEMLRLADIFVLNSRVDDDGDMEGTPNSILEAMCMGKAVVSTRHAGIPYVIENRVNGLLANENDNNELRNSIELLINNPEMRKELGEKAKNTVHNLYTTQIMEAKLKEVFRSL